MKKLTLLALLITLCIFACKKDSPNLNSAESSIIGIENDPLFYQWAQTVNGRWIPYSLDIIDQRRLNQENVWETLNASTIKIYNARKHYEALLFKKYGDGTSNLTNQLYALYKENYEKINSSLQKRAVMDSLYSLYEKIGKPVSDKRVMSNSRTSNLTDLDDVEIITCQIPQSLLNFYAIFAMNPFPTYTPPGQTKTCHTEKIEKFGEAISMMRYTFRENYFGPNDCIYWKGMAYDAMREYYNCNGYDNFPGDSPNDPFAPVGWEGGGGGLPPTQPEYELFKIKTDSLDAKYPCVKKSILNPLLNSGLWVLYTSPFISDEIASPNLIWDATPQVYGTGGTYALGETYGTGYSAHIRLNSNAIQNASQLYVATAVIHETFHGYINYIINAGKYGVNNIHTDSWGVSVEVFASLDSLHNAGLGNYVDHSLLVDVLFDNMVDILKEFVGDTYTIKECRMAMLYGLNNPGSAFLPTTPEAQKLTASFNRILNKYGITSTELNNFNQSNLVGVPAAKKVPTTCP